MNFSMRYINLLITLLILNFFGACSIMDKNYFEQQVRTYINQFETNLKKTDDIILNQFRVAKSEKTLLKAIAVMQNKNLSSDSIECIINFKQPTIVFEDIAVRVELMVLHQSIDVENVLKEQTKLTLWLSYDDDAELYISDIDADELYNKHRSLTYKLAGLKRQKKDIAIRDIYFDQAKALRKKYDSIIWYTTYQDSTYYYVINGSWSNYFLSTERVWQPTYKMGLVSETGREVIPPEYDLVGTMGFELPGIIEVKKNGLVGHYNLLGLEIISAEYDLILPYSNDSVYALTKMDTLYGWVDKLDFSYHSGLDSALVKYIDNFNFLERAVVISAENTTMTEILNIENMGFGIVVPPTHYVKANVFPEIVSDIHTGFNSLGWGGTSSIESNGSFFFELVDNVSAFLVQLTDRYVEGREGFYNRNKLNFIDANDNVIASYKIRAGSFTYNRIDSALLEIRISPPIYSDYEYEMEGVETEWNPTLFQYFDISNPNKISQLESKREYGFTEFVKLDSSYFAGDFAYWDDVRNEKAIRNFISETTLKLIRDEILSYNGYLFTQEEIIRRYEGKKWYNPRYKRYSEFMDSMSDIDRHNLLFLETLVGTLDSPQPI
ncbi:MAG: WG repeat-containing protein [Cyclobacteriaceae bacterium]